ncbi:hypothetical protein AKJ37_05345 [candidate division MSBL1 archaeon SCGC-AAA259I09]|uniref:Uncharacterized protein n=1 Tax=candidate division MSBL1 archaeon SCGC-AAA259I09 TaxID=1698267 RepID=A0A133UQB0_9EURY|nr:hypothetical protein AKJ37_05345 [candidate division MSBL1 archaeon SCGC-AAA259I09]
MNRRIGKAGGVLLISFLVGWLCFIYKSRGVEWSKAIYSLAGPWVVVAAILLLWEVFKKRDPKEEA